MGKIEIINYNINVTYQIVRVRSNKMHIIITTRYPRRLAVKLSFKNCIVNICSKRSADHIFLDTYTTHTVNVDL